jgi:hypothetical protein
VGLSIMAPRMALKTVCESSWLKLGSK